MKCKVSRSIQFGAAKVFCERREERFHHLGNGKGVRRYKSPRDNLRAVNFFSKCVLSECGPATTEK